MLGSHLLLYVAIPLLVLAALYWVIRLAVRDGILAARARSSEQRP
ncbi:hypothetical protein [Cellulomonas sp. P5_C5]